jgi:hypothetical protein
VLWEDVVSVEQAKKPDPNLQEEAVLQLSNAVLEIPRHQQRHFIIVYFTDWRSIEFYKYDYDEHEVVFRSGLMQFFHETLNTSKLTDGFLMYIAFRLSSPSILGFQSIIVEIPHKVKNFFDGNEVDLIRSGKDTKPSIYASRLSNTDQISTSISTSNSQQFVLKQHTRCDVFQSELNVLTKLNSLKSSLMRNVPYFPTLVDFSKDSLLIAIQPFDPYTLSDAPFSDNLLREVCQGGAWILRNLHQLGIAYCDPSPNNILVMGNDINGWNAIWNDYADTRHLNIELSEFIGTHVRIGQKLATMKLSTVYTKIDDCLAVFFSILEFCTLVKIGHSRRLKWDRYKTKSQSIAEIWGSKVCWCQLSTEEAFNESIINVQPSSMTILRSLFENWIRNPDYEKGLCDLEKFGVSNIKSVKIANVYHYDGTIGTNFHSSIKSCGRARLVSSSLCSLDAKKKKCPKCFPEDVKLVCGCNDCSSNDKKC